MPDLGFMQHALGDGCQACREIRRTGPHDDRCPLGKHLSASTTPEATPAEAASRRYEQDSRRSRARSRLAKAVLGQFAPVRRRSA
jgi:hypothetical protein